MKDILEKEECEALGLSGLCVERNGHPTGNGTFLRYLQPGTLSSGGLPYFTPHETDEIADVHRPTYTARDRPQTTRVAHESNHEQKCRHRSCFFVCFLRANTITVSRSHGAWRHCAVAFLTAASAPG